MKTILHLYRFDIREPAEKAAYADLCAKLGAMGLKVFESCGGQLTHYATAKAIGDGAEVDLETSHLFNNQWNTPTHRVFDWGQDCLQNPFLKQGYWLEQTDDMREIRRNRNKCGYCGHQEEAQHGLVFHLDCLGSEYLKKSEIYLTRMQPVTDGLKAAPPLTDAEKAHLLPIYKEAQLHGRTARDKARIAKMRADIATKYQKAILAATTEADGMTWLMDHGFRTDNVIYYSHTNKFCFGWRAPLEGDVLSAWLDIASEFPFEYEIKKA